MKKLVFIAIALMLLPLAGRAEGFSILPGLSVDNNMKLSYGLLAGAYFNEHHGLFVRAKHSFTGSSVDGRYDPDGGGHEPWFTGKDRTIRWAATLGYSYKINRHLAVLAGAGYGKRSLRWEKLGGGWMEITPSSTKGIEAEAGLTAFFGIFAINAGIQTNSFKYSELNIGIGISF